MPIWWSSRLSVGAGLLAMVVNDKAYELNERGVLETIASKPALQVLGYPHFPGLRQDPFFCVQNNPSLSGSSYSDGVQLGPLVLPGFPKVGSLARHSTR